MYSIRQSNKMPPKKRQVQPQHMISSHQEDVLGSITQVSEAESPQDQIFHNISYTWHQNVKRSHYNKEINVPLLLSKSTANKKRHNNSLIISAIRGKMGIGMQETVQLIHIPTVADIFHVGITVVNETGRVQIETPVDKMHPWEVKLLLSENKYYLLKSRLKKPGHDTQETKRHKEAHDYERINDTQKAPSSIQDRNLMLIRQNSQVEELKSAVDRGQTCLLYGPAGCGKSHIIRQLSEIYNTDQETQKLAIIAPSNTAAININGSTVHTFLGLPSGYEHKDCFTTSKAIKDKILALRVLVIDEISMISAKQMEAISKVLQTILGNDKPFGNLPLILVGDVFQLQAVSSPQDRTPGIFAEAQGFQDIKDNILVIKLQDSWRFDNPEWYRALLSIRDAKPSAEAMTLLRGVQSATGSYDPHEAFRLWNMLQQTHKEVVVLNGHQRAVDDFNAACLQTLSGLVKTYTTRRYNGVTQSLQEHKDYTFKIGAHVMAVANNLKHTYGIYNGLQGVIRNLYEESIDVYFERLDKTVRMESCRYGDLVGIPIRLSYAMTIHKCQGMSLDNVILCIERNNGIFLPSQAYVALSRVRTLNGLYIVGKVEERSFWVSEAAKEFDDWVTQQAGKQSTIIEKNN